MQNNVMKNEIIENSIMNKFLATFMSALLIAGVGVMVGQFIPAVLLIPLYIVELALIIAVVFARKASLSYFLMYCFMFVSGVTLYAVISNYIEQLDGTTVVKAFAVAVIMFSAIAAYGYLTKFHFGFLGNALFFILLALVVISIVGIFVPFPSTFEMIISLVGILLFSAYTLYDFNKIAHDGLSEEEIPSMVISVYLDFINIFLYILRFLSVLKNND